MQSLLETPGQAGDAPREDAAALLRAVGEHADRAAFVALFRHFAPRVKAYLLRLGVPAARAEELAQETMLQVWRKAASYDFQSSGAAAWIFTIARNLRIDAARHDALAGKDVDPLADAPPPAPADTLVETVQRDERVRQAILRLPAEQADVLRLSFFDERPHAEIERALGIPLGTVKSRLRLAMRHLRVLLDELK